MHTCWTLGPVITLPEILDAREHRARKIGRAHV